MCEFEEKVKKSFDDILILSECRKTDLRVGLAVSGGADSIALLLAMSEFVSPLYVITVNHNIRPAEESGGDVDFVISVCRELTQRGRQVECRAVELERGQVQALARQHAGGIEEAARSLRYEAFEKFAEDEGLDLLCTAHTMNDQLETVFMRFLQGSPVEAAGGIRSWRKFDKLPLILARPLLDCSRQEIEAYVKSRNFSWCTDKTNFETDYLRNKLRLKLLPFIDSEIPGWQKAVLAGAEKAREDADFINSFLDDFPLVQTSDSSVQLPCELMQNAHPAIQRRLIIKACNLAGEKSRIPYRFINEVLELLRLNKNFTKRFSGIEIIHKKNTLFVKKCSESNTDLFFSDIIEESGTFEFPFGNLDVFNYREENGRALVSVKIEQSTLVEMLPLPFCIRNARPGDLIVSADGSFKKLSDIFSDWHVTPEDKCLIPVIQLLNEKDQRIIAILAGFLGYKDWIVKL